MLPESLTPATPSAELLTRIRMEYLEMPGLILTGHQARRLWNLDPTLCEVILAALVSEHFLSQSDDGTYLRRERH